MDSTGVVVRLGAKLDIGYSDSDVYGRLFGMRDIPAYLRELGFEAVETPVGLETDGRALLEHARRCIAAGLCISLHPYSEQSPANPAMFTLDADNPCWQFHERFLDLAAQIAQLQNRPTVINIHSAAHSEVLRSQQIERSVQFFRRCRQWCESQGGTARVVAELQIAPHRSESVQRIGDRYDELLEVLQRSDIAACWDFGHAVMNHRNLDYELQPSEDFLDRVAHIHCHDIGTSDHQPLIYGNVPWRDFLAQAAAHGFDGTVILEVPPEHYLANTGLDAVVQSAQSLRQGIAAIGATTRTS